MSSRRGKSDQSRRQFLGNAAAVAGGAGLAAAGCASLGAGQPSGGGVRTVASVPPRTPVLVKDNEPIRLAVIGTGGMGTGHCHAIMGLTEQGRTKTQIVALADVNEVRLGDAHKACQDKQGIEVDKYVDYREILKRDDIHAVLIASTEHWHAQHAIDALTAGKDVYCEKPMTLNLDQALDLRKVVLDNPDRIFQVGTQMMMLPKYLEARKAIKAGAIGKPVWSQTSYCRNSTTGEWNYYGLDDRWQPGVNVDWKGWCGYLGPREWDPKVYARWRRYKDFSTGIIGDLLVHVMTPLIMAVDAGWPTRVTASGHHVVDLEMENFDQVNLNVEFEDGHTMIVAGSTANEVGLETMIRGHEANMYLNSRHCEIRPERIFVDEVDQRTIECPDIGNDQDQLRLNFLECVRTRTPAVSNIDLASKVMVAVDLACRSMWEGHAFRFDPKTMRASRA